jgi:DEAD/DEAH box helicase domain-containing protein
MPQTPTTTLMRLAAGRADRLAQQIELPERVGRRVDIPAWVPDQVTARLTAAGVDRLWAHQVSAAELLRAGNHVLLATGVASGKSLAYQLPIAEAAARGGTALYLSPTKALARDQLGRLAALAGPGLVAAVIDGDTGREERDWARRHASVIVATPDVLHHTLLPQHARWAHLWRSLSVVVIDEAHTYRGLFGSHVAIVTRRLRRIAAHYGASPVFALASATAAAPAAFAADLTGLSVEIVDDDTSGHGPVDVGLWLPAPTSSADVTPPLRRSATAEAADLLVRLVTEGVRTVVFVRSRAGAEQVALDAKRALRENWGGLADTVAAYRAGYLADDRRELESRLHDGRLLGLAATSALELGIDVSGLDAVVIAGFPGSIASLRQQAGRAGRDGQRATVIVVARDEPLDAYLVAHPERLWGDPVEATVLDPDNLRVLTPHLAAAAAELPLVDADELLFGPGFQHAVDALVDAGLVRRRPTGVHWTQQGRPAGLVDLRGAGAQVRIVEAGTGTLLGDVDDRRAPATVHPGAVYVHQGVTYLVEDADWEEHVAFVRSADVDYITQARTHVEITFGDSVDDQASLGAELSYGPLLVASQVTSFRRLRHGEILDEIPVETPRRELDTHGVRLTADVSLMSAARLEAGDRDGAAHALEHALVALLPLFATSDPGDVAGSSFALHPDTGELTIVVHDTAEGGAGFARRAFEAGVHWLAAARDLLAGCDCETGCPRCAISGRCARANEPLDVSAAVRLADALLAGLSTVVASTEAG